MKWQAAALALLTPLVFLTAACDRGSQTKAFDRNHPDPPPVAVAAPASGAAPAGPGATRPTLFTEITRDVGLPGDPPRYPDGTYMTPEITPGGVALLDTDNDGRLDILLVCHPPPGPDAFRQTAPNRLFRQTPEGKFKEVPGAAGLAGKGYHNGAAVGDFDNDGLPDVFVANYGAPDQLFRNNGDGTFTDVTAKSGIKPAGPPEQSWSSTAAFVDYDGDGFLDLVVVHFATFDPKKVCQTSADAADRDYCGPHTFPGQLLTLYHNNGDGTFSDVTRQSGLDTAGRGWGVIAADLTGDDLPDILQANDEEPNQLWVNQGGGKFADEAVLRGCAFNGAGGVEANMGVAVGDVFNRGALDLFITHITSETNTLWRNNGDGTFSDATAAAGMGPVDRPFTGWGCGLFDFDNDGNLDVAVADGRVARGPSRHDAKLGPFWDRFAEPNLLFRGDGAGHFTDVSASAGAFAAVPEVHRALAFGDLFNRGRLDMVCVNLDNTVRVYRNDAPPPANHWLQVLPMAGKREALGAKVFLTAGGKRRLAVCLRAYSYVSSNDPRVHFGLGADPAVDSLEVNWPSGTPRRESFPIPGVDRLLTIRQGQGKGM